MKKNVIWWIGVKNDKYSEKYGGWDWVDISRKSWEYWCKKNDVLFVPFEEPIEKDLTRFRINWQKAIFVFDEMERRNIDYDQICQIDCTHIVKWDTPNFFELTDHKLTAVRDTDNLRWIYDSIVGYGKFFNYKLDMTKYVSSSPMIFNEKHKEVFKSFKKLYYDNVDTFVELQDTTIRKGTEQTPLNYWLQINDVEMNLNLPFSYKLTHMHRKEIFGHNWQLNDDMTPFFIKYGHIWVFTGIPKDKRTDFMTNTWKMVKGNYKESIETEDILLEVEHKDFKKYTTSRKFKKEILDYFSDKKYRDKTILELGCCQGDSTRIYSYLFKKVYAVDNGVDNLKMAKQKCMGRVNVEFINKDVYRDTFDFSDVDVVVIDAGHTYDNVKYDIKRVIDYFDNPIIIIDDYGQPDGQIKKAIDESIKEFDLNVLNYIGESTGFTTANDVVFCDVEGVILNGKN